MTHQTENTILDTVVGTILANGFDGLAEAVTILLNEAMQIERSKFLKAAPWQRTEERNGYANGFKDKTLSSRLGTLPLKVPQVRGENLDFYPSALEKGLRSERALTLSMAEMYIQGVSTRKVTAILENLCGLEVTAAQVSRATSQLDTELNKWRHRPLGCIPFLQLDARYEKVRVGGAVVSCAVLIATGIMEDGKRSVLGVSVSLSEAEVHWRSFLSSLKERGIYGLSMITSDNHEGLKAALRTVFNGVPWQRCQVHLQRNAAAYVTKTYKRQTVASDIRTIFNAPDRQDAERLLTKIVDKYREEMPKLASWMEANIPEGLTTFILPAPQRLRLRTTNMVERLNREIKRRTRVASIFPNEAALLRLVGALLMETSEEWESGKKYLNMEAE